MYSPYRTLLVATVACLSLWGCDDDDDGVSPSDQATVRFVNAMTGTSDLVLRVDGTTAGTSADYQESNGCTGLVPGEVDLTITTGGNTAAIASLSDQDLATGERYTILATGSVVTPNLVLLHDTYPSPTSGRARLRVLNAVGVVNPFDVYVGTPGSALGTPNDVNVEFNSNNEYLDVPEGTTQVRATTPGTQTVVGTSANFGLDSRDVGTLVFTPPGTVGGTFMSFLVPQC